MFWTFKLSFHVYIFGLATVLATFSKIGVNFFPNFLVTLTRTKKETGIAEIKISTTALD